MSSKRRDFLRHVALGGLLAPIAHYFPDIPEARAMDGRTNMVLVFLPNGKVRETPYVSSGTGQRPVFQQGFEPYNAFADRAIALREYSFWEYLRSEYSFGHRGHIGGALTMFSAQAPTETSARGPSIDQVVATEYINRGLAVPLRRSLNVHVSSGGEWKIQSMFTATPSDYTLGRTYDRNLSGVAKFKQPQAAFDLMFGDLAATNQGATMGDLRAYGRSVLDVPAAQLNSIRSSLPTEGALIVDEHLNSLRELEQSFESAAMEPVIGEVPDRPDAASNPERPEDYISLFEQWADLIDSALRLDRTRVVSVQFGSIASRFLIPELGLAATQGSDGASNNGSDHHSYTHHKGGDVWRFMDWYATRISSLLGRLQGDGSQEDMLDRGVVMVGTESGQVHTAHDVPVTLFGSCGGYYNEGTTLTYGNDADGMKKHSGTLLSLAHAMGIPELESFGHPGAAYQAGVPEGLRK